MSEFSNGEREELLELKANALALLEARFVNVEPSVQRDSKILGLFGSLREVRGFKIPKTTWAEAVRCEDSQVWSTMLGRPRSQISHKLEVVETDDCNSEGTPDMVTTYTYDYHADKLTIRQSSHSPAPLGIAIELQKKMGMVEYDNYVAMLASESDTRRSSDTNKYPHFGIDHQPELNQWGRIIVLLTNEPGTFYGSD